MVSNTYSTGSWLGIVRSGSVIVLEAHTDPLIVTGLWEFLGQERTIHGVLNEVTRQFGTGLTGLPDFAIVVQSDRLHAILRGEMTLLARTGEATEIVSGRDVTTWSERSLVLPESLELTLAQPTHAQEPAEPGWLLPVGEAVIRLQSLRMEASAAELGHHGAAARPLAGDGGTAAFGEAAVVEATALEDTAHEVADVESPAFEEPVFETPGFETPVFAAADVEAAALEEADGAAPDYAEAAESLANLSWSEEAGPADDAPAAGDR